MSNITKKNFEMTRGFFLKNVEGLSPDITEVQPEGFNNTIHWHIGHVLTVTEQFMFGFPVKTNFIPANYKELFGKGTKPAEWTEGVPSVKELVAQLKEQVVRLKEIPEETFAETLSQPFLGLETFGELANMALFHEAHHLGQIHTMKRVIEQGVMSK